MSLDREVDVVRGKLLCYHSYRFRGYTSWNNFLIFENGLIPSEPQLPAKVLGDRGPKMTQDGNFEEGAGKELRPVLKKLNYRIWRV